jgi:hypothetical protein
MFLRNIGRSQGVTTENNNIDIFTAARISNLACDTRNMENLVFLMTTTFQRLGSVFVGDVTKAWTHHL